MAIKRAPENKAIMAAPANKAAPTVGLLMAAHGRIDCSCGQTIAACPHVGHAALLLRTEERGCAACREASR